MKRRLLFDVALLLVLAVVAIFVEWMREPHYALHLQAIAAQIASAFSHFAGEVAAAEVTAKGLYRIAGTAA